ncbi:MAG: hypothetical protein K8S55_12745 [Phycisphaerae bacterium]|nr:hypothetical protein [Phycisphaerae bacterium]
MSDKQRKSDSPSTNGAKNPPAVKDRKSKSDSESTSQPIPKPVDINDGIPDRVASPSRRRLVLVMLIFAAWIAFLAYVLFASGSGGA